MPTTDMAQRLQDECPRRIVGLLHIRGVYRHCLCPGSPTVLCFHRDVDLPKGVIPTEAQAELDREEPNHAD